MYLKFKVPIIYFCGLVSSYLQYMICNIYLFKIWFPLKINTFCFYFFLSCRLGNGKKVTLCVPASNDLWSLLDTMKMSDVTLFHMPVLEQLSEEGRTLLKAAKDQGLNTPFIGATTPFTKVKFTII